jgi:hypothetical protein
MLPGPRARVPLVRSGKLRRRSGQDQTSVPVDLAPHIEAAAYESWASPSTPHACRKAESLRVARTCAKLGRRPDGSLRGPPLPHAACERAA